MTAKILGAPRSQIRGMEQKTNREREESKLKNNITQTKPSNNTGGEKSKNHESPALRDISQSDESSELPIYQAPEGDLFMSWGQVGMLSSECISMEVTYEKAEQPMTPEIKGNVNKTVLEANILTSKLPTERNLNEYYTDLYTTRSGNRKVKEAYGSSVAFIGDTILVGAELGVGAGNYTGVVYIDHDVLQYLSLSEYDRLNVGDKNAAAYTIIEKITEFSNSAVGIAMIVILPAIALAALAFYRSSHIDQHTMFSSNVSPVAQYTHSRDSSNSTECFPLKSKIDSSRSDSSTKDRRMRFEVEGSMMPQEEGEGENDIEQSKSTASSVKKNIQIGSKRNILDRVNGYLIPAKVSFSGIVAVTRGYMKGQQTDADDECNILRAASDEMLQENIREKTGTLPREIFSDEKNVLHNSDDAGEKIISTSSSAANKLNISMTLREKERENDVEARERRRGEGKEGEEERGGEGEKKLLMRI